jgi:serine protease Do
MQQLPGIEIRLPATFIHFMSAEKHMPWSLARAVAVCSVATFTFTGCLQESGITSSHASSAPSAPTAPAIPARVALPDFSPLVEAVGPAVVNISVTSVDKSSRRVASPFEEGEDPFDFFRRFGIPIPGQQGQQNQQAEPRVQQGVGSGFIISGDGYILTNAHVVENATEVTVKLSDKRSFKAKVIGADKRTDVALIKIDGKDLPSVKTGDPDKAKAGQWVLAIGSPFDLENTVTAGIISAKGRRLAGDGYVSYIQSDVAVNPGNSGGPMINLDGEVIGINSQIYSRSGGYMGISFATPIDVALRIKDQLQKHGKVSRGSLGVVIQGMDKDLAQTFGLDKATGALVSTIVAGSPAEKAGIKNGDVIIEVDNTKIDEYSDLPRTIGDHHPGDTVKLKVWRDKHPQEISVKLGEQNADASAADTEDDTSAAPGGKLGLVVRPLNSREAKRGGVDAGLVVAQVTGAAAKAGIHQGDIILAVGNQVVTSTEQWNRAIKAAGNTVALLVQRGDTQQYVLVRTN